MKDTESVIERAYSAFNARDVDGALALMTEEVSWPKASEGGRVVGRDEIRAYWARQWSEFDPHVEPLAMTQEEEARCASGCAKSSRPLKGMFFQIARSCTYSP
jgi:ketosteroid isomerase-like protein